MLIAPMPHELRQSTWNCGKYTALLGWSLRFADLAMVAVAGILAWWVRFGTLVPAIEYQRYIASGVLIALPVFSLSRLYRSWRGRGLAGELWTMLGAYGTIFGLTLLYAMTLKLTGEISRVWWFSWFLVAIASGTGARIVLRHAARWTRERGMDQRTAVIVGGGADAARVIEALARQRGSGIRMLGWFDGVGNSSGALGAPRLGNLHNLAGYVEAQQVNQVWVVLPYSAQHDIARILDVLAHSTADIKFVPDLLGLQLLNHSVEQVAGLPVINLQQTPLHGDARLIKALEDRILALLILLAIWPLMALIAIAVKLSSPGPVFYRQERMSWNNKTFGMLKFRSMPVNTEKKTGAVWAKAGESRATRVGSFLRKTSLDELPQFLNVLMGDMSIVGPRPERPVFVERFKHEVPAYMKKHMVKAGITGWAQVNGWRGDTDLTRRIECDLFYIENWSLAFDIRIIFQTLIKGFMHKNAY